MADLDSLQQALGITFKDLSLLQQALVHRSYLNENPNFGLPSNERLEFLGDAILGLIVAEKLYQEFPHFAEGELTRFRGALVCKETLSRLALSRGLGDYLYLSQGEHMSEGRLKPTNLTGALEAVIGAVFLDQGLAVTKDLLLKLLDGEFKRIKAEGVDTDYKSRLQEVVQARHRLTPIYRVVETTGPDHAKRFTVEAIAGDIILGRGSGRGKRSAEMAAARSALERLEGNKIE